MAIRIKKSHEGKLHRALGVPANQTIPLGKIERATHSKSPSLRREAQFALNARKWNKK